VGINGQTNTPELRNNSIQRHFSEIRGNHHYDVVKVGEHLASGISGGKLLLNELERVSKTDSKQGGGKRTTLINPSSGVYWLALVAGHPPP
jgi:hypothetical protein